MTHSTQRRRTVPALLTLATLILHPFLLSTSAFAQAKKPISKDGLVEAVRLKGYTTRELVKQIENRGVSFEMTSEVETQLVNAGARPEIIQAARTNFRAAVGTLNVTSSVAGTEITVSGNGTTVDRITGMKLQPGQYTVEGKLPGYRTVTTEVEMKAGETSNVKLELVALNAGEAPAEESTRPARSAPSRDASATELAFWDSIKSSSNPDDFKLYIKKYPSGAFVELANARLERFEQDVRDAEQQETSRRQAAEFARISVAGSTWQGTSVGGDKQYAFAFDQGGTFRMGMVYWGIRSATTGVWSQEGAEVRITLASPKDGEMVAMVNGRQMQGEWHVPQKKGIHTYRFVMQRIQ